MSTQKFAQHHLLFAAFSLLLFAASCGKGNDNPTPGGTNPPAAGTWKITYLFSREDHTSAVSSYSFEFKSDGTLSATNGSQTWNGTWSTNCDDSANKFCIFFNSSVPSALSELEEDWLIVEKKDNFMHFEHTSGGDGHVDVVHFTKQ